MALDPLYYFKLAKELEAAHQELFNSHLVHLRPNRKSLSVVSLHPNTPELGFKCKVDKNATNSQLNTAFFQQSISNMKSPGRETPEKALQAYLIRKALDNNNQFDFDKDIYFFTSELAGNTTEKIVVDILGFNVRTKALVLIELKTKRALTELTNQLYDYKTMVKTDIDFYQKALAIHGYEWIAPFVIEKIAVWPASKQPKRFAADIREFGYAMEGGSYTICESS